jgi:phosphoribosylanthranilate isomerase
MRTLTRDDFEALHAAFVDAFSDYVVKLSPTREQLAEMLTRRGYVPDASVAEVEGDRIVAFTLNGIDGTTAYDTGTGVVPSHRRRGLANAMLSFIGPVLREHGCTEYVLEVLEANPAARALYLGAGFRETRGLQSWTFEAPKHPDQPGRPPRNLDDAETRGSWWTITPSWQNATHSIARARDSHVVLGDEHAYAILFPSNGDLAQLAVRPDMRRKGIGARLLHEAAAIAGKPLRIMNVDERDEGIARFLEATGAKHMVRQVEMAKKLAADVKICCISSHDEARMAIDAGADVLGLVSAMPSGPGVIDEALIASIAAAVDVETFLLTSLRDVDAIVAQHRRCGTSGIQICDALPAGSFGRLRDALPGVRLVQVIHVVGEASYPEAMDAAKGVDALLLDSGNPSLQVKELGGTGRVHDWTVSRRICADAGVPVFLAGGLRPENVADALATTGATGVDICSGVRTEGRLDRAKLDRFIAAVVSPRS